MFGGGLGHGSIMSDHGMGERAEHGEVDEWAWHGGGHGREGA